MAHGGDRLAGVQHLLDQCNRGPVFGQVPQRTVATGVEHTVKIGCGYLGQLVRVRQCILRSLVFFKAARGVGLCVGRVALGVKWRLAALGRGQRDLDARVEEHVIGRCKLLEPEAGFFTGVAECAVRGQNHQDFFSHGVVSFFL